jgi:hypothetical protein
LTHLVQVGPPSEAAATTAATATAATATAATAAATACHQSGCTQSQRDHTAGQDQCFLQYVHNFHWFKVLSYSKMRLSRHRMRNSFSGRQLLCQPCKRLFYQQKTEFSAERTPLDAQSLHKVAQKMRGREE